MRVHDMTHGSPARLIVTFALPLMAGSVFQQLYTVADAAIVGNFVGVDALASLGATDWFNYLILSVLMGCIQGFSILLSQRFGARDESGLRKAFASSARLSALLALVMLVLSEGFAAPVLSLLNTPEAIFGGALLYIRVYFAGIPFIACYNLLSGALRALGDSRSPLVAMVISSLSNILLDLLFVVVFHWGIAGAAAATLIAQGESMLYCLLIVRKAPQLRLHREDRVREPALEKQLLKLGLPIALQNLVIGCGGMAVQTVINGFGFLFIAGCTATNKLYGLLELAAVSFGHALSVYTGQNMGAGQLRRIREGQKAATLISLVTSAAICALMLIFGRSILSLFISAEPAAYELVMGYAMDFLRLMSLCLPVLYMLYVYRSILQGMGDTVTPMLSGFMELLLRVACAIVLGAAVGEYGIYIAEVAAWTGAAVLLAFAYYGRMRKLRARDEG